MKKAYAICKVGLITGIGESAYTDTPILNEKKERMIFSNKPDAENYLKTYLSINKGYLTLIKEVYVYDY